MQFTFEEQRCASGGTARTLAAACSRSRAAFSTQAGGACCCPRRGHPPAPNSVNIHIGNLFTYCTWGAAQWCGRGASLKRTTTPPTHPAAAAAAAAASKNARGPPAVRRTCAAADGAGQTEGSGRQVTQGLIYKSCRLGRRREAGVRLGVEEGEAPPKK